MENGSKRLAKNTMLLYVRMLLVMFVGLYTSRVILQTLGVEDFGIYNVVGGVVSMFSLLSGSLSSAISRFITFALGKGDKEHLKKVFSTSVTIQIILTAIIIVVAEIAGIWFINHKMMIDAERLSAAHWCFQFSLLTFAVNLISIPYNAAIVAHERMAAFAYISVVEVVGKLLIAYGIGMVAFDKLVVYGLLLAILALVIRLLYGIYCSKHFEECHYHFIWDSKLLKEIFSFSGWNFIGSSAALFRDQGGNILLNLFFGPSVNAARGIAMQVNHAVYGFVQNFMTALKPQITKNYASGNHDQVMKLIFVGSRFSFYLLLFLALPVIINTRYILSLWLGVLPDHVVQFTRLVLIFALCESISNPLIVAQAATGKIRNYQIIVGGCIMLCFPISYLLFRVGFPPEATFLTSIAISFICLFIRLILLRKMIGLSLGKFMKNVCINIVAVSFFAFIVPYIMHEYLNDELECFVLTTAVSCICSGVSIFFIGCNKEERSLVLNNVSKLYKKIGKK